MNKLSVFAIALAVGTGAGLTLDNGLRTQTAEKTDTPVAIPNDASNAAFRDGLYQAKLAVQRGDQAHIATGRWASDTDRASFAAGYRQGYQEAQGGGSM